MALSTTAASLAGALGMPQRSPLSTLDAPSLWVLFVVAGTLLALLCLCSSRRTNSRRKKWRARTANGAPAEYGAPSCDDDDDDDDDEGDDDDDGDDGDDHAALQGSADGDADRYNDGYGAGRHDGERFQDGDDGAYDDRSDDRYDDRYDGDGDERRGASRGGAPVRGRYQAEARARADGPPDYPTDRGTLPRSSNRSVSGVLTLPSCGSSARKSGTSGERQLLRGGTRRPGGGAPQWRWDR